MPQALPPIPDSFALGVCDYPEHVPWEQWREYPARMADLGITYVRVAEFAWSRIEPEPGRFEWSWLDDAIDALHAAGRRVVLCTPTATPPAWLIRAHPEILPYDKEGRRLNFGSRKHYDHASPVYREHSRRITRAVAARYGRHDAVAGWQTDNEWGVHSTTRSYGGASTVAFRAWLERRYGTTDALNEAWGNVFWSQEYTAWDQVDPPILTPAEPNPSHVLDFHRFASDAVAEFQAEQVEILRELSPGRWLTHNFMQWFDEFDHYRNVEPLDFASWDSYPAGFAERTDLLPEEEKHRWVRTGHPDLVSFNHDLYRGLKGRRAFWVMEQGCGQVNWAASNALPAEGAVALWTAQAFAHGASCVSYFRWRAATMAQELMHSGLLRHDGSPDRGAHEVAALEIVGAPVGETPARVALLHDYESAWAYDTQPHAEGLSYARQTFLFYRALRSLGVDVDVVHVDADLAGYDLVVAPAIQLLDEPRAARLAAAARSSRMLFGPRTAFRDLSGKVPPDGQPGPLRDLLGCTLLNVDGLRLGMTVSVDGEVVTHWAESYRATTGSTLHVYDDGPLAGQPAVVREENVITVGALSPVLIARMAALLLTEAGVEVTPLEDGVRVARHAGIPVWMNFTQDEVELPDGRRLGPVAYAVG